MWSREKLDMLRKMLIIWQEAGDDAEKVIPGHVMKGLYSMFTPQVKGIHWLTQNRGRVTHPDLL